MKQLASVWGDVRETPAQRKRLITKYRKLLSGDALDLADPRRGRAIYDKTCGQCHKMFGRGGRLGPELTGSSRKDVEYLLINVLDPSATVSADYRMTLVATEDGRTISGLVDAESDTSLTISNVDGEFVLDKSEVVARKTLDESMMPIGVVEKMPDGDVLDLVSYLQSDTQVEPRKTDSTSASSNASAEERLKQPSTRTPR